MDDEVYGRPPACYRCHSQKLRCIRTRHQKDCNRCKQAEEDCIPRPSKRRRKSASARLNDRPLHAAISPPPTTTEASHIGSEEQYRDSPHDSDGSLTSNFGTSTLKDPASRQFTSPGDHFGLWDGVDIMQQYFPVGFDSAFGANLAFDFGQSEPRPSVSATQVDSGLSTPVSSAFFDGPQEIVIDQITVDESSCGHTTRTTAGVQGRVPCYCQSEIPSPHLNFAERSQPAPVAGKDRRAHLTPMINGNSPSNTSTADRWSCDLAALNVKLFLHKMSTTEAIRRLQNTDTTPQQSPRRDTGRGSTDEPRHAREARDATPPFSCFPLDETLRLALELVRLLETLSIPVTDIRSGSTPLAANSDSQQRLATAGITNRGLNTSRGRIHVDQASRALLLSCYTCLLVILREMFTSLQQLLGDVHATHRPARPCSNIHSTLPSIEIGSLSLDPTPKLRATLVLALAQSLVDDISLKFKITLSTRRGGDRSAEMAPPECESRYTIAPSCLGERGCRNEMGNDGVDDAMWEAVRVEHDAFSRHAASLKQSLIGHNF